MLLPELQLCTLEINSQEQECKWGCTLPIWCVRISLGKLGGRYRLLQQRFGHFFQLQVCSPWTNLVDSANPSNVLSWWQKFSTCFPFFFFFLLGVVVWGAGGTVFWVWFFILSFTTCVTGKSKILIFPNWPWNNQIEGHLQQLTSKQSQNWWLPAITGWHSILPDWLNGEEKWGLIR